MSFRDEALKDIPSERSSRSDEMSSSLVPLLLIITMAKGCRGKFECGMHAKKVGEKMSTQAKRDSSERNKERRSS